MQRFVKLRHLPFALVALVLSACAAQLVPLPAPPNVFPPEPQAELSAATAVVQSHSVLLNQMACLSAAAYVGQDQPDATCRQWEQGPGIEMHSFPVTLQNIWGHTYPGSYTIIVDNNRRQQAIAIRGTDNFNDWLTDLQFHPVFDDILNVWVHHGFQIYARAVLDDLLGPNQHIRLFNPTYDTYITGHSLGGAAAVVLSLYLYTRYPNALRVDGVYTYGQPKVFDNDGAISWPKFADGIYHVENCYDPVALVPLANDVAHSVFFSPLSVREARNQYEHIGHEIVLLDPGMYWVPGQNELVRNTVGDLDAAIDAIKHNRQTDHAISLYIQRLRMLNSPVNPVNRFASVCHPS